ncbi:hypothetical protein B0H16DRAFT_1418853 [Mycena metata]|uniref:Uncharacterized protein n=1 Tax=Mycena metata TaxID=1033252 RepID=A0AAD7NAV3_9AGAR|nr:hypothetical protein B0H16DRAFT_1418853 [Mycena metata]
MYFFESLPKHIPRPKAILSPREASQRAEGIRSHLFASWGRLQKIVLAHEETIQKRWKKRTGAKRKQLLQEIEPTLPEQHAPEITALSQPSATQKLNAFLFPYLNLEDLSINNGVQFLGLLHARTHYAPSQFAWFDYNTLHFGIVVGGIDRYHAMDCGMVVFGDEDTYGKVLEYSEPLEKSDETAPDGGQMEFILRESMPFGDGLAVLHTQLKLMDFLLAVVSKILCDVDLATFTPVAPLPPPDILILNTTFQWQSRARLNALKPYRPPPVFSIDEITVIIDSQYELAVQHLADLRTDPIYLAETIASYCAHRIETILTAPLPLIRKRALTLMLSDTYSFFVFYHVAKEIIAEFRVVQAKFPDIPRARELPKEYEDALKNLYPILGLIEKHITKVHHQTMCASSALSAGRSIECNDPTYTKHKITFSPQPGDELYAYMVLLLQEQQTHMWQVSRIFDQLDRLTQDGTARERISPLIGNLLSQWGVVNDCKFILELHRPAVEDDQDLQTGIQERLTKWHPLIASIVSGVSPPTPLADLAFPLTRFAYPKGPKDGAWAAKCQRVDDEFSAFWRTADQWLLKVCGRPLYTLGAEVIAPYRVEPTDWAAVAARKVAIRLKPTPDALVPFGGAEQSPPTEEAVPTVKIKEKTRGAIATSATEEDVDSREREVALVAPTPVSTRAYKVFSALFNAAKDEEIALQQSSVPWKDIQTAFAQLGFELHKTRGSAWTFRHPDGPKTVTVHEPHPSPTMSFWEARRFGRRLTRRFGWTLESFVLDAAAA